MTFKLYTDENIPHAVSGALREHGIDVLTCHDAGLRGAKDLEHLALATAQGRTLVTGDIDFLTLDAEYRADGKRHAGIIYIPSDKLRAYGTIIAFVVFLYNSVVVGAADLETDVFGVVWRVTE